MSKVTMQDIADELGISRVTVWKVFNNQVFQKQYGKAYSKKLKN